MQSYAVLKREFDKYYRQLASYKEEEYYIEDQIKRYEVEIEELEKQWKNDVSQRGFNTIVKPLVEELDRGTIIPLQRFIYNESASQDKNAITYNYIQSLRKEVREYTIRLKKIQKDMNEIEVILGMIDRELVSLK